MINWELTRAPGAPAIAPVLSLEEARLHLRVDAAGGSHPDDTLIQAYVQAATDELDGGDGWLGRALCTQQWLLTLDSFPAGAIKLPLPPLQTVDSIGYVSLDGAAQTLSPSAYRVLDWSDPARVEPVYGTSWPATRGQADAVSITFTCGFGDPADVPELIRNYIRLRVGQSYENRELVAMGVTIAEIPFLRDSLENFRRSVRPV
jgi:uncharacterized phiE125 gp8 family phage protein